jgi:hypothetical protein
MQRKNRRRCAAEKRKCGTCLKIERSIAMAGVSYDVITALHNKLEAFAVHNASAKECWVADDRTYPLTFEVLVRDVDHQRGPSPRTRTD